MFNIAGTRRRISITLLRISGVDEHRYARWFPAGTTDNADSYTPTRNRVTPALLRPAPHPKGKETTIRWEQDGGKNGNDRLGSQRWMCPGCRTTCATRGHPGRHRVLACEWACYMKSAKPDPLPLRHTGWHDNTHPRRNRRKLRRRCPGTRHLNRMD